jgi:hypothetical protein
MFPRPQAPRTVVKVLSYVSQYAAGRLPVCSAPCGVDSVVALHVKS